MESKPVTNSPKEGAKTAAERMEAMHKRRRSAGMVRRDRWAHPDDWPAIDAFIAKLADARRLLPDEAVKAIQRAMETAR